MFAYFLYIINVWIVLWELHKILNDTLIFLTNMSLSNISVLITKKKPKKKRKLILHEKNGKVNLGNVFCAPSHDVTKD